MKNGKTLKKIGLTLTCALSTTLVFASPIVRDSIGVENQGGKKVILHKLESKESYYSLGRKYKLKTQNIIDFNNNKALKAGDVIKIPTGQAFSAGATASSPKASSKRTSGDDVYTVGPKETLFALAKRFGVSVAAIKQANGLTGDGLQAGQQLKIPGASGTTSATAPVSAATKTTTGANRVISDEELNNGTATNAQQAIKEEETPVKAKVQEQVANVEEKKEVVEEKKEEIQEQAAATVNDAKTAEDSAAANRYGIKQVAENGLGVWVDDLNGETGKMLALHNTAPIGTVIKLTNPMTNRTTYAKVVGKFNTTEQNKGAIVVVSKPVASLIGVIDRKFQVNLSY